LRRLPLRDLFPIRRPGLGVWLRGGSGVESVSVLGSVGPSTTGFRGRDGLRGSVKAHREGDEKRLPCSGWHPSLTLLRRTVLIWLRWVVELAKMCRGAFRSPPGSDLPPVKWRTVEGALSRPSPRLRRRAVPGQSAGSPPQVRREDRGRERRACDRRPRRFSRRDAMIAGPTLSPVKWRPVASTCP
jgi:hypothetical protein